MENVLIRDYAPKDFEDIAILWQETDLGNPSRGDNDQTINESIRIGGKMFVLEETHSQKVIGTSWITYDGRRLHWHHFGIKPEYQGKGFAKELAKYTLDYAQKQGIQIKLEVHQQNNRAISLYKKLGFQYLGDYDVYIFRNYGSIE